MHGAATRAALGLAAMLVLAGCVTIGDGEPEESTAPPREDATTTTTPAPATPPDDGAGGDPDVAPGQGQEQGQGQGQNVAVNQTVIVNVGPTPQNPPTTTPLAPPTPTPPDDDDDDDAPEPQVWPRAGSHVAYVVQWHDVDADAVTRTQARAEWTHDGRDWRGTCTAVEEREDAQGATTTTRTTRTYTASDPPHWPLFNSRQTPHVGGPIDTWHLHVCEIVSGHHQYAGETTATWNGRTVDAHAAVELDEERDAKDFRTAWDDRTGLVLRWDLQESDGDRLVGELAATDAPLAWR